MNTARQHSMPIGRKIAKLRVMKEMKQSELAKKLNISHQSISRIEKSDKIDDSKLSDIASALGVTLDELKSFNDEISAIQIQEMRDNSQAIYQYNLNPLDKILELSEKLINSEREKVTILEGLLKNEQDRNHKLQQLLDKIYHKLES